MFERIRNLFSRAAPQPVESTNRHGWWLPGRHGGLVITHDKALHLAACFACVRAISEDIAKMPWRVYAVQNGKRIHMDRSPLERILKTRPNPDTSSIAFRETLLQWALTWGNAYAEIERDNAGRPIALWQISPDRVEAKRDGAGVYYEVNNGQGEKTTIQSADMFHLHGPGYDGITGYSMVTLAAESLGFGLAAEQHGAGYYGNNAQVGTIFKHPMGISDQAFARLKESMDKRSGSGAAFKPLLLEEGMSIEKAAFNQVDSQYIETRDQIVEEIARWWRVPPSKIGHLKNAHYNNMEQSNASYAEEALGAWIKRLEEEADWKLIGNRSQASFTKLDNKALMRGDSQARAQYYKEMMLIGAYSINEIRQLEDMDPIGPEGDEHYLQAQMRTLKDIAEGEPEPVEPEPTPEEVAEPAVRAWAMRFAAFDMDKAEKAAKYRYPDDRMGFVEWMGRHQAGQRNRRSKALADLMPSIIKAYGGAVDEHDILDIYEAQSRQMQLRIYDEGTGDAVPLASAVMDAIRPEPPALEVMG